MSLIDSGIPCLTFFPYFPGDQRSMKHRMMNASSINVLCGCGVSPWRFSLFSFSFFFHWTESLPNQWIPRLLPLIESLWSRCSVLFPSPVSLPFESKRTGEKMSPWLQLWEQDHHLFHNGYCHAIAWRKSATAGRKERLNDKERRRGPKKGYIVCLFLLSIVCFLPSLTTTNSFSHVTTRKTCLGVKTRGEWSSGCHFSSLDEFFSSHFAYSFTLDTSSSASDVNEAGCCLNHTIITLLSMFE